MKYLPSAEWIRNYKKEWFGGDISAGLTVGIMLIPQSMAYAVLAGLDPIYGLYSSTVPIIIYALLGTSMQLAVGPVAITSLLLASGLSPLANPGTDLYLYYTVLLSFMVGLIHLFMGIFRLGFLVNFLSHPVLAGFTTAAAIIIGFSQLKHLFGIQVNGEKFVDIVTQIVQQFTQIHPISMMIGVGCIFLLVILKKIHRLIPSPLLVVLLSILLVYFGDLSSKGVKIVGMIPEGLPSLQMPDFDLHTLRLLLPTAITIAFVGFMESIAVAKAIHLRHKDYELDSNQELIALGIANIGGSFFRSFPVTGGFSRTAVNDQAGAKTGLASIISALIIILTLLFFTSYFYYLPNATLAAIIIVAVYSLIDVKEAKNLWQTDKIDFYLFLVSALSTLIFGIEEGILIGVALSIATLVYRVSYPHYAELGQLKGKNEFKNVLRFSDAIIKDEIIIVRFDAQLFFANTAFFKEKLMSIVKSRNNPKFLILDGSAINHMDSSAVHTLEEVIEELKKSGITFITANFIGPVRDILMKTNLESKIGREHIFLGLNEAYCYTLREVERNA